MALIGRLLNKFGYDVSISRRRAPTTSPYSTLVQSRSVIDLEALSDISITIPGMISEQSGKMLYALCYMQETRGDVVEIGSWQGRSASFLAMAVKDSGNGRLYAVDHFRGNVGKEHYYVVNKEDLSDLRSNFIRNMTRLSLMDEIHLFDMTNDEAASRMDGVAIRFLFVDGDHTADGVRKDIALFFPKLVPGAIVVFDDFSPHFPDLCGAVDELLAAKMPPKVMSYHNTIVLKLE